MSMRTKLLSHCMIVLHSFVYNVGLCKPREYVEFDHWYLSEKVTHSL